MGGGNAPRGSYGSIATLKSQAGAAAVHPTADIRLRCGKRRFGPFASRTLDITGCSVEAEARGMDIGITTVGPIDEARHRVQQGLA